MKKIKILLIACVALSLQGMAQTKTSSEGKVGETVNKVGNKTAKVAVKTTSGIIDKKYEGKAGPDGETVYINKKSKYYYVDAKGKKIFITKAELKNKE
ncbi:MAG: hypothetical protein ABIU63_10275 [Chitinophagaceae bacterium]